MVLGSEHIDTSFVPINDSHGSSSFPLGFGDNDPNSKCLRCVSNRLNYDSMRRRCIHDIARAQDRQDYDRLRASFANEPKKLKNLEIQYGADVTKNPHELKKEVSVFKDHHRGYRALKAGPETECGKRHLLDLFTPGSPWLTRPQNQCQKECGAILTKPAGMGDLSFLSLLSPVNRKLSISSFI